MAIGRRDQLRRRGRVVGKGDGDASRSLPGGDGADAVEGERGAILVLERVRPILHAQAVRGAELGMVAALPASRMHCSVWEPIATS